MATGIAEVRVYCREWVSWGCDASRSIAIHRVELKHRQEPCIALAFLQCIITHQ